MYRGNDMLVDDFTKDLLLRIEENHGKMIFLNYQSSISRFLMCIPHYKTPQGNEAYNDYCKKLTASFTGKYGVDAHLMSAKWENLEQWQRDTFIAEAKRYVDKIQEDTLK